MTPTLLHEMRNGVLTLTLNRPDHLNPLSLATAEEMDAAVVAAATEGVRALVITGAGRAFSSGADLKGPLGQTTGRPRDLGRGLETHINPLLERLAAAPFPVITAVNGPAVGVGAGLALAGDFILASQDSYFLFPFAKLGLVPDGGATYRLGRVIGYHRALSLFMLGDRLGAPQARDWGLVHSVHDGPDLAEAAATLADRLAQGSTPALALTRRNLRMAQEQSFTESLRAERTTQALACLTPDFEEGVAAFAGRRPPRFAGAPNPPIEQENAE